MQLGTIAKQQPLGGAGLSVIGVRRAGRIPEPAMRLGEASYEALARITEWYGVIDVSRLFENSKYSSQRDHPQQVRQAAAV